MHRPLVLPSSLVASYAIVLLQKPTDEKRHLMRLWLAPENDWELPEAFATRWGGSKVGDRGGIYIPNTIPRAPLDAGQS